MNKLGVFLAAGLMLASAVATAQAPMRIRGTITSLDGDMLSVKTRDGKDLKVSLAPNFAVAAAKAVTLADFKPGSYVGSTAKKNAAGQLVASEVHRLPPTAPPGHTPWDTSPGDTMTNANVASVVKAAGGNELTLEYKGGTQKILVPDGTPIVDFVPGDRSLLVPGATVFVAATMGADGKIAAPRVAVSKDGVKPPQ
ncbi:MAG TPA: hypothetical protein VEF92_02105 [Burkholderiales bacterium]|nr:hypothetical protein [Burkholderiales bacterium]HYA46319.1 hypothetical protein [Burkholderiales bacterium]